MLRPLYNWTMAKAAHPHAEWYLAGLAFMDGGLFPFPPHPLLGLMCLAEPKKAVRFALITTFASLLGGLLGYAIGHFLYDTIGTQMLSALGLTEKFPKAACYLRAYGWQIIVVKAATPIPFLLISVTAGFISFPLWLFAVASLASRAIIFVTIGVLFRIFGAPIKRFIDKYLIWLAGAFVVLVVGGYFAFAMISGKGHVTGEKCDAATSISAPA
ncbi:MAG: VTT domain-containing protein [Pseudomonadota bacterium]|nr:VTT domain-containing protein [Pseudomonadota bacterium]